MECGGYRHPDMGGVGGGGGGLWLAMGCLTCEDGILMRGVVGWLWSGCRMAGVMVVRWLG